MRLLNCTRFKDYLQILKIGRDLLLTVQTSLFIFCIEDFRFS